MVVVEFSSDKLVKTLQRSIAGLLVFSAVVALGSCHMGCLPAKSGAEAAYAAEIGACSATAKTLADAKTCRREVNTRYGLCESAQWPNITPCDE